MSTSPAYVGSYRTEVLNYVNGFGARPRILWLAPITSGLSGSRLHAITCSQNTGGTRSVDLLHGKRITRASDMGSPSISSLNAINRTAGSFITDGWQIGDRLYIQGCTTVANDAVGFVTSVGASTLSFAGSTFSSNEVIPSTAVLYRVANLHRTNVPNNSGFADGSPSVSLLNPSMMPALDITPGRFLTMGYAEVLLIKADSATPSNTSLEVTAFGGDY